MRRDSYLGRIARRAAAVSPSQPPVHRKRKEHATDPKGQDTKGLSSPPPSALPANVEARFTEKSREEGAPSAATASRDLPTQQETLPDMGGEKSALSPMEDAHRQRAAQTRPDLHSPAEHTAALPGVLPITERATAKEIFSLLPAASDGIPTAVRPALQQHVAEPAAQVSRDAAAVSGTDTERIPVPSPLTSAPVREKTVPATEAVQAEPENAARAEQSASTAALFTASLAPIVRPPARAEAWQTENVLAEIREEPNASLSARSAPEIPDPVSATEWAGKEAYPEQPLRPAPLPERVRGESDVARAQQDQRPDSFAAPASESQMPEVSVRRLAEALGSAAALANAGLEAERMFLLPAASARRPPEAAPNGEDRQGPTVHIGSIEIQIAPLTPVIMPPAPQTVMPTTFAEAERALVTEFTGFYGLRQG
ncbi:MAG: hypothetical protein JWL77_3550 [Chthonomonadaceae bacterium]|nr:hypothetical protein [Chthonomonadaceae bacterium]